MTAQVPLHKRSPVAFLGLVTAIPHSNQVEATWKHSSLEQSQEKAGRQQARVAAYKTLTDGAEAEEEHAAREPYVRAEALQQDVGRDLKEDIRNKEDDEGGVVLIFLNTEFELRRQAVDVGIGNVHTGKWLEEKSQ